MIQATLCFITLISLSMSATIQNKELQKNMNKELLYVGNYGDKVYFTETSDMTWDQANAYCDSHGMVLVSASTPGEVAFLIKLNYEELGARRLWTSGRRGSDVFTWGNGNVIDAFVHIKHPGCIVLLGQLHEDPCDGSLGYNYNPLCEA